MCTWEPVTTIPTSTTRQVIGCWCALVEWSELILNSDSDSML